MEEDKATKKIQGVGENARAVSFCPHLCFLHVGGSC